MKKNLGTANSIQHWLFPSSFSDAIEIQKEIAKSVLIEDVLPKKIDYIAGMDVSNTWHDPDKMIFASTVVLSYPSISLIESLASLQQQKFPYIPGLLGFREAPILYDIFFKLKQRPDLIIIDGHGIAHPRRCGIASHLGVLLDIPTIGVAKNILFGKRTGNLSDEVGGVDYLLSGGIRLGAVVRTKKRARPIIISPGHKITLQTALDIVLSCIKKYKLPEPTRYAHKEANKIRNHYRLNKENIEF